MKLIRKLTISLFLCLLIFNAEAQKQGPWRVLTPDQQKEDLNTWLTGFKKDHPGLYRWSSPNEIDRAFNKALSHANQEQNIWEFFHKVSELNATVRCGHSPLNVSNEIRNRVFGPGALLPPISVRVLENGIFIKEVLLENTNLKAGQQLVSINGHKMNDIQRKIYNLFHADGFNETVKRKDLEDKFAALYVLFIEEGKKTYEIAVGAGDESKTETLAGVDFRTWGRKIRPDNPPKPWTMDWLENESIAKIKITTLSDGAYEKSGFDFEQLLDSTFSILAKKQTENLLLDLRGLSGGSDLYVVDLLSYLMAEPFRVFERIEVTESYVAPPEGGERAIAKIDDQGRKVIVNHPGLKITPLKPNHFKGKVHVIIDGGTFSAGADLAAVLHRESRATLYGEESGGGYTGNTSGPGDLLELPNSGLRVPVRQWTYYTAGVDSKVHKSGVPAHVPIKPQMMHYMRVDDPILMYTVSRIMKGN